MILIARKKIVQRIFLEFFRAIAFDGSRVLATPRSQLAIVRRMNITDVELYRIRGNQA